ncbi:MAG TPA: type III pantothenate kinase [Alphaproteobacteria bacterium]|jgi:type III pantothenate kinase|nr:type III pantothenate kinase [Alphaproteobacteria bacterium]
MLLAINCNNTNVKFAVYDGAQQRGSWRISTEARRTADEYAVWLTHLMQLSGLDRRDIDDAIVANVVPPAMFNLKELCRRYFGCEPLVVGDPALDLGLKVLLDNPDEAGADRLVNAVAVRMRYDLPAIVVDFGTATTFDIVDADGNYCGGVIAPGINLSVEALHMAAAKLPRIAVTRPAQVIGKGTISAMQSGVYWGYIGLIEGLIRRIQDEFGRRMTVISTGGLAPLFTEATQVIEHLDPDLTLDGLVEIYRRNRARND